LLPRAIVAHIPTPRRSHRSLARRSLARRDSMQEAEQVQQNDDEDWHAGQPQDDIAQHQ
jgi:hypothetical protein